MESLRILGLELSGAKSDRSAVAVFDFYPKNGRLILLDLDKNFSGHGEYSADQLLIESLNDLESDTKDYKGVAIHGPISLPPLCFQESKQKLSPPWKNEQAQWMEAQWKRIKKKPKPFLPYLQRPVEIYFRYLMPEKFDIPDALGSNWAPIASRFHFIAPYLKGDYFEVLPRATLSRLVSSLGLPKKVAQKYSDFEQGPIQRNRFFETLTEKVPQVFIYQKDLEQMILEQNCFQAFLCGLTLFLHIKGQCERAPKTFPKDASWILIPKSRIDWDKCFSQE